VAALAGPLSSGCGSPRTRGEDADVPPELTFDALAFRVYRGSALSAEGMAVRAAYRRDTADLRADHLDVRFPPEADRAEARVKAVEGTGNVSSRRFEARGGVHAEQAGRVADTEAARWSGEDGLVRGDRPLSVHGTGLRVTGPGFTLDPRDGVLRIEGGARVVSGGERP
jgi:lipopolysaccharide export system protein LptC